MAQILFSEKMSPLPLDRKNIQDNYRIKEADYMPLLIDEANMSETMLTKTRDTAMRLVSAVREGRKKTTGIDSFLSEYSLSSEEGIALMCLAEALLRVPDKETRDKLIKDKLTMGDWSLHLGQSDSFFVNATTWALMLTGKVLSPEKAPSRLSKAIRGFVGRSGEMVIRKAVDKAMRIMSQQFVMGRNINEAIERAKTKEAEGYRYSYDMLGEAALTELDAEGYFNAYQNAIMAIGRSVKAGDSLHERPSVSIKLSGLHPRYNELQRQRVFDETAPKLLALIQSAKAHGIGVTIDAEEADCLELSLDLIEHVFSDPSLSDYAGMGLAVQSYQKRAFYLIDWVAALAKRIGQRLNVRLIKGAYWDTEIKKAQMQGMSDYPVFTRKVFTDVSFQACAKKLFTLTDVIYPQFATHNAYSVAMILSLAGSYRDFEFQCLHGMGNELYEQIVPANRLGIACRIYAPVGSHEYLLAYLVRRLLENGANSSFVNRIVDENAPLTSLIEDPLKKAQSLLSKQSIHIPLPESIFLPVRQNSRGIDITCRKTQFSLQEKGKKILFTEFHAEPMVPGYVGKAPECSVHSPQNKNQFIGRVIEASEENVMLALNNANDAKIKWQNTSVAERAQCLRKLAALLEEHRNTLCIQLCFEAGKTWADAIGEVREAIDFCYYYANEAERLLSHPEVFHGYTGERNEMTLHPRGIIVCISPWNFPLAIFLGQIVAALVTGNVVIAKPAEQTPLIGAFAVTLMRRAGIPDKVIQFLPGKGETIGAALINSPLIDGVIFTGSTQTANIIASSLASRGGKIVPLIAETGGLNAMIVDSSALLEQVVVDVLQSAFGSAGQRCSALRVLYIQEEIYPRMITLIKGAMAQLSLDSPEWLSTDVGPVIDEEALSMLEAHVIKMKDNHEIIYQCEIPSHLNGHFMPPTVIKLSSISELEREVFGPILHVISYKQQAIDKVISEINQTGYGLTFGIHSRINDTVEYIRNRVNAGNCYVNRNIVGAVVGLQPFGGEGLSGTGPKAGGPHYLPRLCVERVLTVNTTAAGGNASLMSLPEEE